MKIEGITAVLLKQTLNAWQQARPLPPDLLQLDALPVTGTCSPAEKSIHLHDWLRDLTGTRLQQQRKAEGQTAVSHPQTRQEITAVIAADSSHHNSELEAWSALYHRYFASISMSAEQLANAASTTPRNFRRRLQTGLERLADTLRREEIAAHGRNRTQHLRRHLPPPDYLQLFGLDRAVTDISQRLLDPDAASFLSIEGIGGIGKTTIAHATAHQLAEHDNWVDILWVSARQQRLTDKGALLDTKGAARTLDDIVTQLVKQSGQTHLAGLSTAEKLEKLRPFFITAPHLIIIDNLETADDVTTLLPALQPLAGVTHFLLTSRHTLGQYPFVAVRSVPILSFTDSHLLVKSELARRDLSVRITQSSMRQLYTAVGGLPLALKLTAAQLRQTNLHYILQQLRQATSDQPYGMYTYIYRQSWELLGDPARQLLLSMLDIAPAGDTISWLRLMSDLPDTVFDVALAQLFDYSLLEPVGRKNAPACRMHRLTATFLQTDILGDWREPSPAHS